MMEAAQLVENREIARNEANLKRYTKGKYPFHTFSNTKNNAMSSTSDNKGNTVLPIRTVTLRITTGEAKKEGNSKRLSDVEFQARKKKGLCFHCSKKYSLDYRCKNREQRELRMYVVNMDEQEFEIVEEVESKNRELNNAEVVE